MSKSMAWKSGQQVLFAGLILLLFTSSSFTQTAISVLPKVGPPSTPLRVSGSGFPPSVAIGIYFDKQELAVTSTDGNGEFSNVRIVVPRSALPGTNWVTALAPRNHQSAKKPFLVQTNWAQLGFSSELRNFNPYENVLNPETVKSLKLNWKSTIAGTKIMAQPTVANGMVYVVPDRSDLFALDARYGAVLWSYPVENESFLSPAIANDVLYTASIPGTVDALNARTGQVLWSNNIAPDPVTSPVVANGVVYFDGGYLYAIDAITGVVLWQGQGSGFVPAAVSGGVVYVSANPNVFALNAATGALLWQFSGLGYLPYAVAEANGVVYLSNQGVIALNANTGDELWENPLQYDYLGSIAIGEKAVYVGTDGIFYALDPITGSVLWQSGKYQQCCPYFSLTVSNGVIYAGSSDGKVYALNARNGVPLWQYSTGGPIDSSPVVVNGMVYVGSEDGSVYAFSLPSGAGSHSTQ